MKVKIGDKIYDAEKEPIMLIFENDTEKSAIVKHLTNMGIKDNIARKYIMYPTKGYDEAVIEKFMLPDQFDYSKLV